MIEWEKRYLSITNALKQRHVYQIWNNIEIHGNTFFANINVILYSLFNIHDQWNLSPGSWLTTQLLCKSNNLLTERNSNKVVGF